MCKIITWNIKGLNSPNKRKLVYHWLKKQKVDILCLQEGHIKNKDKKFSEKHTLGAEFYSLANKKVRGVVFYVNKDLCPIQVFSDSEGRFLALEVVFNKKKTSDSGGICPEWWKRCIR